MPLLESSYLKPNERIPFMCNCNNGGNAIRVVYDNQDTPISYANEGDAGIDLRSAEDCTIFVGQRKLVRCGIRVALPKGTVGMVCPRSGLAGKHGITVLNAPGILDEGYRGEVMVILLNTDSDEPFHVKKGDRIAQLVVAPYIRCEIEEVDELDDTERGTSGFGSTGQE